MRAVNLVPAERRVGASVGLGRSGGGAYAVLGVVVILALLIFLYGSARHEVGSRKAQAQKYSAEAIQAESQAGGLSRYNALIAQSEVRTQAVEQLVDTRFDWAHAFHEMGRVLPKGVSIASLTGQVGSAAEQSSSKASAGTISSATPPGSVPNFVLTGCASSQEEVAQMLERLRLADGVKEATLQSSVSATPSGSGASAGSGSGSCPGSDPTFTVSIVFEPLPASSPKSTSTVADTEGSSK